MLFDWDPKKAATNRRKHGVSFEEAKTVFFDEEAMVYDDPDHSLTEERFLILGLSRRPRALIVVHCHREEGIRLISARPATRNEERTYWEQRR